MTSKYFFLSLLTICSVSLFATTPLVESMYLIHAGDKNVYLEMTIDELQTLLGPPTEIEVTEMSNELHGNDLVCWKYPGLQVSFYDVADRIITKIAIPEGESNFSLGDIEINKSKQSDVLSIFGHPDFQKTNKGDIHLQYDIVPFRKFPYTFILQFRFNPEEICTEIIFQRDDF